MNNDFAVTAGELNAGQIGLIVRVKVSPHVTVEDQLEAVGHGIVKDVISTVLVFTNTHPDSLSTLGGLFAGLQQKQGFTLSHTALVTVVAS
jgi:hypothetical protein